MIEAGRQFGPYTITEPVGAGGMGEVWRATDTNLKRDVAIKALPSSLAQDADRVARFQREAEVLASLNHPNIAHIYGLEKAGDETVLVMELVEGQTLAERIATGPLPIDDALAIAGQILDALESAHERGIVHRDLKPANVKITPDGRVKVLDFGIAKALDTRSAGTAPGLAELTTPAMTEAGIALGTAAYMSPEQARGRPVDQRTDIWAFGCVLYEMLTGQAAFGGQDRTSTLARVLERSADLQALPKSIPSPVRQTISLCLEKDPRRRWHHAGDIRLGLEGRTGTQYPEPATHWRSRTAVLSIAAAALIAFFATVVVTGTYNGTVSVPQSPTRFTIGMPDGRPVGTQGPLALSPDGRDLVFISGLRDNSRIYRRQLDVSFAPEELEAGRGGNSLFVSDDGRDIGFFDPGTSQLMSLPLEGGSATSIAEVQENLGISWGVDGTIVGVEIWGSPLTIRRAGETRFAPLTTLNTARGEISHLWPKLLPDGQHVLFTIWSGDPSWSNAMIAIADVQTGTHQNLLPGVSASYLDSGHIVFWRSDALWAVAFDPDQLELTSEPQRVVSGVRMQAGNGNAHFAVSNAGTLAYVPGTEDMFVETMIVSRDGEILRRLDREFATGDPEFSPDGTRVALTLFVGGIFNIGVYDLERNFLASTWTTGDSLEPAWLDNETLSFQSSFEGNYAEYSIRADGSGTAERLTPAAIGYSDGNAAWTPDGTTLLLPIRRSESMGIWRFERDGAGEPVAVIDSNADEIEPALSPRGDLIAYQSDVNGQQGIYARPFPDVNARRFTIDASGGQFPVFSADGTALYYATSQGIQQVDINYDDAGTASFGQPTLALELEGVGNFDVSPDEQTFVVERFPLETAAREIRVIVNWLDEMKAAVAAD